jgi:hypothetical protein
MSPAVHSRRLTADEIVIELHTTARPEGQDRAELKRTMQMRRSARDLYVIEMVEEDTRIECMRIMLATTTWQVGPGRSTAGLR